MTDNDPRLDDLLDRLPAIMPFPSTPDISARIAAELPHRRPFPARRPTLWRWAAATAVVVILVVAILPGPRNAVADLLGLPGIQIVFTDRAAEDDLPTSIGSSMLFGERTTLSGALAIVPFPLSIPGDESMGDPDEVWVRRSGDVTAVSLVYAAREDLPEVGDTGVGMLLMQIQSGEDVPFLAKRASTLAPPEFVTVNGESGFWIENGELEVLPSEFTGEQNMTRPSGNVLIWADEGVTYRMETALERESAIRIAESLRSASELRSGNQMGLTIVGEVVAIRSPTGSIHHEPSSFSRRHARCPVRFPDRLCSRRWLGVDSAGRTSACGYCGRAVCRSVHRPWS